MPHCIVEYSSGLAQRVAPSFLVNIIYFTVMGTGLFQEEDIKVRATPYDEYKSGSGEFDFVHVTVKMLPGHQAEHKAAVSKRILKSLHRMNLSGTMLSAEVCDLDKDGYFKVLVKA